MLQEYVEQVFVNFLTARLRVISISLNFVPFTLVIQLC